MVKPEGSPQQPTENTQSELGEDLDKSVGIRARRLLDAVANVATSRRTIATGAALTAAVALAGSQSRPSAEHESRSAIVADISYQEIGKNGHPAPKLTPTESHDPIVEKITLVPSNNPFELAQQAIWLAAHPEKYGNKLSLLSRYPGYIEITHGSLYHWLKGSKTFTPANPSNDGEEGKITASPERPIWIDEPVIWTGYVDTPGEPRFAMVTRGNGPSDVRDLNNVYFWNLSMPANYYASKRFYNSYLGLAEPPEGDIPTIDPNGKFRSVGEKSDDLSKYFKLTRQQVAEKLKKLGLVKAQAP